MIWRDKLNLCEKDTQKLKLSKMSAQDLLSKEKELKPFWNEQCRENTLKLWLPTETELVDLDLTSLNISGHKSWFWIRVNSPKSKNSQKSYSISYISSLPDCTELEITKTRLNRLYPTKEQRKIFLKWISVSRYVYNFTVEKLRQHEGKTPNWMSYWKDVIATKLPEFCDEVPFQIKKIAVRDAINALKEGKKRVKKGLIPKFELKFRSKKRPIQSCFIPKSAIKSSGIYPRVSDKGLRYAEPLSESLMDSRLVFRSGKFYIATPFKEKYVVAENQGQYIVSIDPGVRSFHTFYSPNVAGHIGYNDFSRIVRLGQHLDNLIFRASKASKQRKRRMMKAAGRMREKIKNLIDELHHQAARFYVDNFDVILLPKFETSQMANKVHRKIRSKTVRSLMSFAHYRFSQFLKHKAFETGKIVIDVTEEYTSKTHPLSGELLNIGSNRRVNLGFDWIDRDILGAFNIMLKALVDSPGKFRLITVNNS